MANEEIIIQGILEKTNPKGKVQTRWFRLTRSSLGYYNPDKKDKIKGSISIDSIKNLRDMSHGKDSFSFVATDKKGRETREFVLKVKKEQDRVKWVTELWTLKGLAVPISVKNDYRSSINLTTGQSSLLNRGDVAANPAEIPQILETHPLAKSAMYVWLWSKNQEQTEWAPYDPQSQEQIETAFRLKYSKTLLKHGRYENDPYVITIVSETGTMLQQLLKNKDKVRAVQRYPPKNYPDPEPYRWEYEEKSKTNPDSYIPYDKISQVLIEKSFREKKSPVILDHTDFFRSNPYKVFIDFIGKEVNVHQESMKQKKRKVRRVPSTKDALEEMSAPRKEPSRPLAPAPALARSTLARTQAAQTRNELRNSSTNANFGERMDFKPKKKNSIG